MQFHRISPPGLALAILVALAGCGGTSTTPTTTPVSETATSSRPPIEVEGAAIAALDPPITSFGAVRVGESIYIAGGYHGTPHAYSREGQERAVLRLPVAGGRPESIANLPNGIQSPAVIAKGGSLLVIGGMRAENAEGEPARLISVDEMFSVDASSGGVTSFGTLPDGRSSHAAAILGDRIYVVGGWKLTGPGVGTYAQESWVLNANDGSLVARVPQPFGIRALGVAATADRIVAVGGMAGSAPTSEVHVLDPATNTWSNGPAYPGDAFGIAVVAIDGVVYASARDGVIRRLDLAGNAWVDVAKQAFPRFFHQLVAGEAGSIVVLGGILGMSPDARAALVERVKLDGSPSGPIVARIPAFGEARNRQGMAVVGDSLVLFGGNDALDQHSFDADNFEQAAFVVPLGSLVPREIAPFPARRQSMVTVAGPDGKLFALGGFGFEEGVTLSQSQAYALDTETFAWSELPSLPGRRTQFAAAFLGGKLVVAGGLDYDPRREPAAAQFSHYHDVLVSDAGPDALHAAGFELPGSRRAFASAQYQGKLYVVGGMRENFQPVENCAGVLDLATSSFSPIACPSTQRFSADLVVLGGRLYLLGGTIANSQDENAARSIEAYDPATNTWTQLEATIPFDPRHVRAFAHKDRLLVASTHSEDRALRLAWVDPSR